MTDFQEVTDPNDRALVDQEREKRTAARKAIVDVDADNMRARLEHLADIYNALDVEWGKDPFQTIRALNERSYGDISDIADRLEDTLAELGLKPEAEDMEIARTIRSLRRRAEKLPAPQLYDSIPLFGYELVTRERIRQITHERWSAAHDDEHNDHSLAIVAAIYAVAGVEHVSVRRELDINAPNRVPAYIDAWPMSWDQEWDKREEHDRLRCLSIAGALICAEIDRLQRLADQNERDEKARILDRVDPRRDL